jgi:hypothetical protein
VTSLSSGKSYKTFKLVIYDKNGVNCSDVDWRLTNNGKIYAKKVLYD